MRRRTKGAGSLRLRGSTWWITYYVGGHPTAASSGSTDRAIAANLLKQRIGEAAGGRDVAPEKAAIADLRSLAIADYRLRKLRDLKQCRMAPQGAHQSGHWQHSSGAVWRGANAG